MAVKFDLDISGFISVLGATPKAVYTGAKRGLHDAMDEWLAESRDVAPLDSGQLRRLMETEVDGLTGEITANAVESSPKYGRFNYAYWLHEDDGQKANLHTPGTVHKFLDDPAEENRDKWLRHIESEIMTEVKRKGW